MPSRNLPVNIDSQYADDATHPDVKIHQGHHDVVHAFVNQFDTGAPTDGALYFYVASTGLWTALDPSITGSPGPAGADGTSLTLKGGWASDIAYVKGDVVRDGSNTYACKLANTGAVTSNTTYWMLMTQDGTAGTAGPSGATGAQGAKGDPGPSTSLVEVHPDLTDTFTIDAGSYDYLVGTLTENCDVNFEDSTGAAVSAVTVRLFQGGGPYTVAWAGVTWLTSDGLPPDSSGMSAGDFTVLAFDQVNGDWCGYAPGSGTGAPPPATTYPTLAFDIPFVVFNNADSVAPHTSYVTGTSFQAGNGRVAHAFVVTTTDSTLGDPPIPTITGGGATSGWTQGATQVMGTGTTRRRLTHFVAQDSVSGAAAPITVNIGGIAHTSCHVVIVRTTKSPLTARALAAGNSAGAQSGTPTLSCTLAGAEDAANRGIACIVDNGTTSVLTPEANWVIDPAFPQSINQPTSRIHIITNTTAFDITPSATWSLAVVSGIIATECEQGPLV